MLGVAKEARFWFKEQRILQKWVGPLIFVPGASCIHTLVLELRLELGGAPTSSIFGWDSCKIAACLRALLGRSGFLGL